LINDDPQVTAYPAGVFDRIVIQARVQGPAGNGLPITASSSGGATVIMTAFNPTLCCANVTGSPVTEENPAVPGEILNLYATGIGLPVLTDEIQALLVTGAKFPQNGPETRPSGDQEFFVSSLAGGKTADVLSAKLLPGTVGQYLVVVHLNSDIPTDSHTQLTIAQSTFVSNIITFPVVNTNPQ
jgi:uncharacterized protein (TIGR03437 family)